MSLFEFGMLCVAVGAMLGLWADHLINGGGK